MNSFKHDPGLPDNVIAKAKPSFTSLTEDSPIKKYLHGKTHNQNEVAYEMVWECIPKDIFVGGEVLDFSLLNATSHFNIGAKTVTQLLEALKTSWENTLKKGVNPLTSIVFVVQSTERDKTKIKEMKVLRGQGKKAKDKTQQEERVTYAAGEF